MCRAVHVKCFDFQGRERYLCVREGFPGIEQSVLDAQVLCHLPASYRFYKWL